jgi:hypothetical protein
MQSAIERQREKCESDGEREREREREREIEVERTTRRRLLSRYRQGRPSMEQFTPPPDFEQDTFRLAAL